MKNTAFILVLLVVTAFAATTVALSCSAPSERVTYSVVRTELDGERTENSVENISVWGHSSDRLELHLDELQITMKAQR